ncbi:hypothetical protein Y032_0010g876 [Ancylostoma ceylanicum]|uniref:Uncharacterized protein n=1 Tax=Ancylostoma ceylanicum TaxID=53326 RepID=A0A016VH73_9BILA|nr:hypothetical protein Y032_0010g876 [Ancylostoma ceylanicum]
MNDRNRKLESHSNLVPIITYALDGAVYATLRYRYGNYFTVIKKFRLYHRKLFSLMSRVFRNSWDEC